MQGNLSQLPKPLYPLNGFGYTSETNPDKFSQFSYLPKISIITPSFNQANFLEEAIRSFICQNYPNLEIIIVDGGSKDNSVEVIQRYEKYITYWVSERDKGTYDANNKALAVMTGDYWCVVNSDDALTENAIFYLVEYLNSVETKPDWISSGIQIINERSEVKAKVMPKVPPRVAGRTFSHSCWIYHPCTFLSKQVYSVVGKFHPTDIMDFRYWVEMEILDYFPVMLDKHLASLRFHTNCKSNDYLKMYRLLLELIKYQKKIDVDKLSFNDSLQYNSRIKQVELEYYILKAKAEIFERRLFDALKTMLLVAIVSPKQLLKRWYWGAMFRYFVGGMKEKDYSPLAFMSNPEVLEPAK